MVVLRKSRIREMTPKERNDKIVELKGELLSLRLKARSGSIESSGRIKAIRRTVARLKTIANEEARESNE